MRPLIAAVAFAAILPACVSSEQPRDRTPEAGARKRLDRQGEGLSISGIVLNDRQEPQPRVLVQAFPAGHLVTTKEFHTREPSPMSGGGSAYTDVGGRFRMTGLGVGEYRVAAEPTSFLSPAPSAKLEAVYATTFYPSTRHEREAASVLVSATTETTISIVRVRVPGARVSGSVVSASGRQVTGLSVRLSHRFGGFGSERSVALVRADGTFQTPLVPPGWYGLRVERTPTSNDDRGEFAGQFIEVRDRDLDGVDLVLRKGATISGRVALEPGVVIPTPIGLRVTASRTQFSNHLVNATVAEDWSFHMRGLLGGFRFYVVADRPPQVKATRLTVDGAETPAAEAVEFKGGDHEVVVSIALREPPPPIVDASLPTAALVEQFKTEEMSWRQFAVAQEIVKRGDRGVLRTLEGWLKHQNRRVRGNAAFVFAGLGDPRGFQVITNILTDRSDRPRGEIAGGNWTLQAQIRSDRYYAAHLLGDLRDPRGVAVLVPLLQDRDVKEIIPWSLAQIGDRRAIEPLLETLKDPDPSIRVATIYALEEMRAREALPQLVALLNDHAKSNFGAQVSVAQAAKVAIAKLQ